MHATMHMQMWHNCIARNEPSRRHRTLQLSRPTKSKSMERLRGGAEQVAARKVACACAFSGERTE